MTRSTCWWRRGVAERASVPGAEQRSLPTSLSRPLSRRAVMSAAGIHRREFAASSAASAPRPHAYRGPLFSGFDAASSVSWRTNCGTGHRPALDITGTHRMRGDAFLCGTGPGTSSRRTRQCTPRAGAQYRRLGLDTRGDAHGLRGRAVDACIAPRAALFAIGDVIGGVQLTRSRSRRACCIATTCSGEEARWIQRSPRPSSASPISEPSVRPRSGRENVLRLSRCSSPASGP